MVGARWDRLDGRRDHASRPAARRRRRAPSSPPRRRGPAGGPRREPATGRRRTSSRPRSPARSSRRCRRRSRATGVVPVRVPADARPVPPRRDAPRARTAWPTTRRRRPWSRRSSSGSPVRGPRSTTCLPASATAGGQFASSSTSRTSARRRGAAGHRRGKGDAESEPASRATLVARWVSLARRAAGGRPAPDATSILPAGLAPGKATVATFTLTAPAAVGEYLLSST